MATIEGKSSAEWFKDAAQRQKRSNAYSKYEEPAKPEPARQTAAMPKPASHASPAKAESKPDLGKLISSTQAIITKARGAPEAPKKAEPVRSVPNFNERKQQTGIAKAVAEAKMKRDTLKTATVAKPKPEMAADRPAAKFWDEGTARKAVAEMKADEAKEKAAERESYLSTKRRYTGTSF